MTNGILIVNGIPLIVNGTHFRSKNENSIICGEWNLSNGEKSFRSVYTNERRSPCFWKRYPIDHLHAL